MSRLPALASGLILVAALAGCVDQGQTPEEKSTATSETAASGPRDSGSTGDSRQFEDRLLEIAQSYEIYDRQSLEDQLTAEECASATSSSQPPSIPQFSASEDSTTHGRKLYSLFVKDGPDPLWFIGWTTPEEPNPVGEVLVEEAWLPEEVKDDERPLDPVSRVVKVRVGDRLVDHTEEFLPYARKDGRLYHAARKAGLFIMFKTDPQTPGTDDGWVYGTVTADGKQVTSSGRVASCMACHQNAPHDHLFVHHEK